jgi:protein TonB
VVAQEVDPSQPVDLTGNTFIQGTASAYAGGVTTSSGTSTVAVHSREVASEPPRVAPAMPSQARPVQLEEEDWSCPWPPEADTERIDEQLVVVQVMVDVEGRAESAVVLEDPGFGFGQAAVDCARRAHYAPAQDSEGRPTRARSPPLRVRFTR